MCDQMEFPKTFDEFAEGYGFKDKEEVYTNGIDLIPVFRVKQWLEHLTQMKDTNGAAPGVWLRREYLQGGIIDIKFACSNCGYESGHVMTSWKYCPACGSRNYLTIKENKQCGSCKYCVPCSSILDAGVGYCTKTDEGIRVSLGFYCCEKYEEGENKE